jgi:oligopeptide/dipeptide ABC transporter ATP-binding protein
VELAPTARLYSAPSHPYTRALLSAVPRPDPRGRDERRRIVLEGDVPSPVAPPSGCAFHPRCWFPARDEECMLAVPPLAGVGRGHFARCIKLEGTAPEEGSILT